MIIEHTPARHTVVHFSPTEVAATGLPPKPMFVEYDDVMNLFNYSGWVSKNFRFDQHADKIIKMADQAVGWS